MEAKYEDYDKPTVNYVHKQIIHWMQANKTIK